MKTRLLLFTKATLTLYHQCSYDPAAERFICQELLCNFGTIWTGFAVSIKKHARGQIYTVSLLTIIETLDFARNNQDVTALQNV